MSPDTPIRVDPALERFLQALERKPALADRTALPLPPGPDLREVDASEDKIARFTTAATSCGCRVHNAGGADWIPVVCELLVTHGARDVFALPEAETALTLPRHAALVAALAPHNISVRTSIDDETLFAVDAAVTGVQLAIAETGTIVCRSGPGQARGASLIPPLHVALVCAPQIVPDLFDAFDQLAALGALPTNVNLITGPSKTADIEGVLVTGVHGPGAVHIVLVS